MYTTYKTKKRIERLLLKCYRSTNGLAQFLTNLELESSLKQQTNYVTRIAWCQININKLYRYV